jgi:IclR family pca regulon transcriptional regulator
MSVNLVVGSRLPAHATSMGKVLLAHVSDTELDAFFAGAPLRPLTKRTISDEEGLRRVLAEVRERGWALADQESEEGIRSVAAPIWTRGGRVAAAINVSAHASRASQAEMCRRYLPVLLDAANAISRSLGGAVSSLGG